MNLNQYHRELLVMRTYLNKFGIGVGYRGSPGFIQALNDLIAEGYVMHIDIDFNPDVRQWIHVYQLTEKGIELCKQHNIVAKSP